MKALNRKKFLQIPAVKRERMRALCGASVFGICFSNGHSLALPSKFSRRVFLSQISAFGLVAPAKALQNKNDALCGTGFFTHIYEYKCTEIGDIEDEGASKGLSSTEESSIDGLMSKFDLGSVETQSTDSEPETGSRDSSPKME